LKDVIEKSFKALPEKGVGSGDNEGFNYLRG
jgi:hypothetical protein